MAVMHRPALLVADEATSALDVITQAEILELFAHLNRETGMSILYISHDLPSVAGICQRLAILHEGEIVDKILHARIIDLVANPPDVELCEVMVGRLLHGYPAAMV